MSEPVFRTIGINGRPALDFDGSARWTNPPIHYLAIIPTRRKQSWRRRLRNLLRGGPTTKWVTTTDSEVAKLEAALCDYYEVK